MLITRLWSKQPGKYFFISTKSATGTWKDHAFKKSEFKDVPRFLKDNSDKDLYFCPHGFDKPKRTKPHAVMPNLLWSDMDESDPRKSKLKPSVAIESSPGRFVGLWVLDDKPMTEALNRRLAYGLGADVSGWDLTQVLRVPGTTNYKYASNPRTKLLWQDGPSYKFDDIDSRLPSEKKLTPTGSSDAAEIYKKWKGKFPPWLCRELMKRDQPPPGKRSEMIWKIGAQLMEAGVPEDDAICLIKASVWNKFAGRRNEDEQLKREWDKQINSHLHAKKEVVGEYDDDYEYLAKPICAVEEEEIDWIWHPFVARKTVTILEGDPEAGKSFIAQYLSARICMGYHMPCEEDVPKVKGSVAYFDVENDPNAVTKKRLRWFGGYEKLPNFYQEDRTFSIDDPVEMEKVYRALERVRPALCVFDTLNTYIGSANTNQGAQSQQSFVKFLDLAKRFNCAVLVLRHLTKGGRDKAMYRGQGNIAFTGVARVQMLAGKHPTNPDLRVVARSKGNLTKKPRALVYEVSDGSTLEERDRARFKWHEFEDIDAEDIVAVAEPEKNGKEKSEAREFLNEVLETGPMELDRLLKMAESRSISDRTLRRAGKEMRIIATTKGFGKKKVTKWELPSND